MEASTWVPPPNFAISAKANGKSLDTSALVKLITNETESAALRLDLGARTELNWFAGGVERVQEVFRAASRTGERSAVRARPDPPVEPET